jgi:hypothetical protein
VTLRAGEVLSWAAEGALARPLIVDAHHGVVGELLELGGQSRAFRDEPRDGAVRRRQEGTGEAGDCSFEDRLWISARPTVRIVFTRFCKLRFIASAASQDSPVDTLYLERKGLVGRPGFGEASKACDLIRERPANAVSIWTMAVSAERADPVVWGAFRALVEACPLRTQQYAPSPPRRYRRS